MSSYRTTTRSQYSQRNTSRKPPQTPTATPEIKRNNQVDAAKEDNSLMNGNSTVAVKDGFYSDDGSCTNVSNNDGAIPQENKTKRKVRLVFSRCRDRSATKSRPNSFKLVSVPCSEIDVKTSSPDCALMSNTQP